jgi:hypothetical protein
MGCATLSLRQLRSSWRMWTLQWSFRQLSVVRLAGPCVWPKFHWKNQGMYTYLLIFCWFF